ncbi:MAG: hypothetical protein JRS35_26455, partial [Deltaproteobacteria bacterium]|nr:hypothetical protein [Deltaproteobacteria bacterium]
MRGWGGWNGLPTLMRTGPLLAVKLGAPLLMLSILLAPLAALAANEASAANEVLTSAAAESVDWWVWPLVLLVVTFLMGIVA